jgi:N4-gp56 family major capsid protein
MAVLGSAITSDTNVTRVANMAPEVMTYYEKVFLARAEFEFVLKEGGQMRTHAVNQGQTVNFTRYEPLSILTTPLGELSNPAACSMNSCTVAMTLSEYGMTTIHSKLLTTISIDSGMKEKIELVGQNMGETLNRLVRAELENGTDYWGNDHTADTIASGDNLDACNIRMVVQKLEIAKAKAYKDGMFIGKTDPISKYNLLGDSAWLNAKTYSDVQDLYKGEMGELYQVRFLLNKDVSSGIEAASSAASAVIRYYTYIHGDNSFGVYDLAQDKPKLYILPNAVDSNSPAGRATFISWAGSFATQLLNSSWAMSCRFTA